MITAVIDAAAGKATGSSHQSSDVESNADAEGQPTQARGAFKAVSRRLSRHVNDADGLAEQAPIGRTRRRHGAELRGGEETIQRRRSRFVMVSPMLRSGSQ